MLQEHRLIGITQAQLDAQRKKAGVTPISTAKPTSVATNPTKVASSSATGTKPTNTLLTQTDRMSAAEANANLQNIQRANTLSTKPGEVKSYIDPKTGVDTRYMVNGVDTRTINKPLYQDFEVGKDADGKPIYEQRLVANPGQMTQGTLYGQDVLGVQFQNTDKGVNAAMGLAEQGGQTAGYTSPYNTPSASSLGQIDQSAYNRLLEAGRTPQQALAEIQGNRPDVQAAFNQVGTGLRPQTLEQRQQEAAAGAAQRLRDMGVGDPNLINQAASQAAQDVLNQDTAQIQNQTALSEQQRQQAAATAASGAAANKAATAQTSGIPPEIDAALAGMDPIEAGLIRAKLQAGTTEAAAGQTAALQNFADETKAADASLNAYDKVLDKAEADSKQLYEASRDIVEDSEERQKENLAREQQNALEQLAWAEQKATRDGKKALQKQIDSMVTAQALSGGYGSSNWNAEVTQAEFDGEMAIADAQQQFAFKRADVAIAYTNSLNTIYDNAAVRKLEALKAYKSDLATNNQYRFSATEKTEERKVKAKQDLNNSLATIAKEQAAGIKDAIKDVKIAMKEQQQDLLDKEDRALKQINSLLDKFPESEVRQMVLDLGKDVTSFSVEKMLNAKSKEEIKAAQNAAFARSQLNAMLLSQRQANAPLETYDDFINKKIAQKEQELGETMNSKSRADFMKANESYFLAEYGQYSAPNFENITSGNPKVDAAVDAYMSGDLSAKDAAKTFGVSVGDVVTYTGVLREKGSQIGDIRALGKEQRGELTTLRNSIKQSDITKKLDAMKMAVPKIDIASDASSGVGDVALLNFYQNGIVDPGLAVRAEDQKLLMKASALRDKVNRDYAEGVLLNAESFPQATRDEMARIATEVYKATSRIYDEQVYAPAVQTAEQSGISEAYFNYLKKTDANSLGNSADSYVDSYLP